MEWRSRERFLAACACQPVDRPPVWIMRQAGRYLPEYRDLKQKYTFVDLVRTPELATLVTLQPIHRFSLDAAILFSDILVIPEALGQPYHFHPDKGIRMAFSLESEKAITKLDATAIHDKLQYVAEAIKLIRHELKGHKALIGFGGSPWTLAAYMVEGSGSAHFTKIKTLYYQNRSQFYALQEKLTQALIAYFKMQIEAGVDTLQIFDSCAVICAGQDYYEMSLRWIKQIVEALPHDIPITLFAKGMAHHLDVIKETNIRVISVDWTVDLGSLQKKLSGNYSLQGNLDPVILSTEPEIVQHEAIKMLKTVNPYKGYIANLGHGILPTAKIENVETFIETICRLNKASNG